MTRATVARDSQVRICDAREGLSETVRGRDTVYSTRETNVKVVKCHDRAVKRIVTEDSPDVFLTVSEVCLSASQVYRKNCKLRVK